MIPLDSSQVFYPLSCTQVSISHVLWALFSLGLTPDLSLCYELQWHQWFLSAREGRMGLASCTLHSSGFRRDTDGSLTASCPSLPVPKPNPPL